MLGKHQFSRKAVDDFLKSLHPINKRKFALEIRTDPPGKTILDMMEITFTKTSSPRTLTRITTREETPLKSRTIHRTTSPGPHKLELMKMIGSPLNLSRRNVTPLPTRLKPKLIVTRLPYVKWTT